MQLTRAGSTNVTQNLSNTSVKIVQLYLQYESKSSPTPKTFCGIFSPGEPV